MKRTKKLLAILPLLFMMAGCGGKNSSSDPKTTDNTIITTNNEEDKVDVRYQIYLSAVSAGYDGNYEKWLESIKGDSIQLKVENNYVELVGKKLNEIYKNRIYYFGNNTGMLFEDSKNNLSFAAMDNNCYIHMLDITNFKHNIYYFP